MTYSEHDDRITILERDLAWAIGELNDAKKELENKVSGEDFKLLSRNIQHNRYTMDSRMLTVLEYAPSWVFKRYESLKEFKAFLEERVRLYEHFSRDW